jgi:hypothetical protein
MLNHRIVITICHELVNVCGLHRIAQPMYLVENYVAFDGELMILLCSLVDSIV